MNFAVYEPAERRPAVLPASMGDDAVFAAARSSHNWREFDFGL
jgi:hypothetical protein